MKHTEIFYSSFVYRFIIASSSWPFAFVHYSKSIFRHIPRHAHGPPHSFHTDSLTAIHTHTLTHQPNAESATLHSYMQFLFLLFSDFEELLRILSTSVSVSPISCMHFFIAMQTNSECKDDMIKRHTDTGTDVPVHTATLLKRDTQPCTIITWFSFRFPHN